MPGLFTSAQSDPVRQTHSLALLTRTKALGIGPLRKPTPPSGFFEKTPSTGRIRRPYVLTPSACDRAARTSPSM
jgi:hypothetical protein